MPLWRQRLLQRTFAGRRSNKLRSNTFLIAGRGLCAAHSISPVGLVRLSFPQGLACTLHSRTNFNLHRTSCGEDGEARGCVDKNCPLSAEDCCRRCTVVNYLGSSASCQLLNKRMRLQETICQRANSARQRPPIRSTKMLQASACVLQLSLMLRRCKTSAERNVDRAPRCSVLFCCVPSSMQANKIRLRPRSKLPSCQKKRRANDKALPLLICFCS